MARSLTGASGQEGCGSSKIKFKRPVLFAAILCLLALLLAAAPPRAAALDEAGANIPQPPPELYYLDGANILSQDTRSLILSKSQELYSQYGVQLAVITADSLPEGGYTQRVAYLRDVMSGWQLGGSDGHGLLLAISINDSDYVAVAGGALKHEFTTEALKALMDAELEPDFQQGRYDAGISKFYTSAVEKAGAYCAQHPELFAPAAAAPAPAGSPSKGLPAWMLVLLIVAGALLAASTAMYLLSLHASRRWHSSRRRVHGPNHIHRHNPVITPTRTNVLRHESRATVHIKSTRQTTGVYRSQKSSHNRTNIDWRQ